MSKKWMWKLTGFALVFACAVAVFGIAAPSAAFAGGNAAIEGTVGTESEVEETAPEAPSLYFSSGDNFSDAGSDFWGYYFINEDKDAPLTKLSLHGAGPMEETTEDGSAAAKYKYVVGSSDFISNDYHQYLGIWGGLAMHPGGKADVILSFIAPMDGVIHITDTVKKQSGGDGIRLYTTLNGLAPENKIYPAEEDFVLHTTEADTVYDLDDLTVKRGDEIFFRVNRNGSLANDNTYFNPIVTYKSYVLPEMNLLLTASELSFPVGGLRMIGASFDVNLGNSFQFVFASSDESVATVDDYGIITGVAAGKADITVSDAVTGKSAVCRVEITAEDREVKKSGCGAVALSGGSGGRGNFTVALAVLCAAFLGAGLFAARRRAVTIKDRHDKTA